MSEPLDYLSLNRDSWNRRTEVHVASAFYDMERFLSGQTSLKHIELERLGDVRGLSILHLQCHFGQDTLSLARMGAEVVGVDLSDAAIAQAQALANQIGQEASFLCCDLYDLPNHLDRQFDLVFTSYGTIGWLPDMDKWAGVVARFLKPGGRFLFVEFHPVVWMFDNNLDKVGYRYFNSGPLLEVETGTYADRNAPLHQEYVCWNHGLGEVVNALIGQGLEIQSLEEFDYAPYDVLHNMRNEGPEIYRVAHLGNQIPLIYALQALKKP